MIKPIIFLSSIIATAVGQYTSLIPSLIPTTTPDVTRDYWSCATHNITSYLQPPQPTGALLEALWSYGAVLWDELCEKDALSCPYPAQTRWCAFTDVAPQTLLPAYSAAGKEAQEWLASRIPEMLPIARECPNYWYKAMERVMLGGLFLNNTISMADCYAQARLGGAESTSTTQMVTATSTVAEARPASTGSQAPTPTSTGSQATTSTPTGGVQRREAKGPLSMILVGSLAVAAAHMAL